MKRMSCEEYLRGGVGDGEPITVEVTREQLRTVFGVHLTDDEFLKAGDTVQVQPGVTAIIMD